ncbi:MAG: hypothetical protein LUG91_04370 [Ruminococcus sp.]|nr:hypothetical protein [Ruminococcus sp.]
MGAILSLLLGMLSGIPDNNNNNNKNKNKKSNSRHGGYDEEERFDNDFYDEESESEDYDDYD